MSSPTAGYFGRRPVLLFSMYTSILVTVFCAVVPNYYTLLFSRILIGSTVGLNVSVSGVYLGEMVTDEKLYKFGTFLTSLIFATGAGWIGLLGYFLLEKVGWRIFVLFTSLPIFIGPIILLQFFLPETPTYLKKKKPADAGKNLLPAVHKMKWVILGKIGLMFFVNNYNGHGSMLLLPGIMRTDNEQHNKSGTYDCNAIFGDQFLVLAVVSGLCNIVGRLIGYWLHGKFNFRKFMVFMTSVIILAYIGISTFEDVLVKEMFMGILKVAYAIMTNELLIVSYNPRVLGEETLNLSAGIIQFICYSGSVMGTSMAVFASNSTAIYTCIGLNVGMFFVTCTVYEL